MGSNTEAATLSVEMESQEAVEVATAIINLLHVDAWYEVPDEWFEEFGRNIFSLAQHRNAFL